MVICVWKKKRAFKYHWKKRVRKKKRNIGGEGWRESAFLFALAVDFWFAHWLAHPRFSCSPQLPLCQSPKGMTFYLFKKMSCLARRENFLQGNWRDKKQAQEAKGDGRWAAMLNIQPFTSLFLLATYTLSEDTSSFPRFPFSFRFNKYVLFRLLNPVLSSL